MNNYCKQGNCECKFMEDVRRYAIDIPELYKRIDTATNQYNAVVAQNKSLQGELLISKKINTYHLQYKADSKELDEYFKKEPTYILTIEKLRDEIEKLRDETKMISELCPYCGQEVKLINKFEKQYCPKCGELIKHCSLCDNDIVNCNYCELGKDGVDD